MPKAKLQPKQVGPAPFIAAMARKMGIVKHLDEIIPWDKKRCKLSPGTRILALVINILISRKPLYLLPEFYRSYDCELIFGHGIKADDINDDAIGRLLDMLDGVDLVDIYGQLAMMVNQSIYGHNKLGDVHLDRTSVSLYGAYTHEPEYPEELEVIFGASKAHRPDLKQFTVGMAVNKDGLPLLADIGDGNQPENPWFRKFIPRFDEHYSKENLETFAAIGDAAFVSEENLNRLFSSDRASQISFISRLPATYKEEKWVRSRALSGLGQWINLGKMSEEKNASSYKCYTDRVSIGGVVYRALVYSSTSLEQRKEHSLQKSWEKKREVLLKDCQEAEGSFFACEADALRAAETVIAKHKQSVWTVPYVIKDARKDTCWFVPQKGRKPTKQTVVSGNGHSIQLIFGDPVMNEEKANMEHDLASLFVLITNVSDEEADEQEILRRYKDQSSVEVSFKFLKGPCILGPIFLKKEHRIEALGIIFVIALLIGMAIQIRVRRGVASRQRQHNAGYRQTDAPTIKVILQTFDHVIITCDARGKRTAYYQNDFDAEYILLDCELDEAIWTTVPD